MKVIFIVQGEGRGHLTQAIAMERLLTNNGYHVTEVLVGKSLSKRLPGFFTRSIQAPIKQFQVLTSCLHGLIHGPIFHTA